jgi:hypothetical protein
VGPRPSLGKDPTPRGSARSPTLASPTAICEVLLGHRPHDTCCERGHVLYRALHVKLLALDKGCPVERRRRRWVPQRQTEGPDRRFTATWAHHPRHHGDHEP